MLGNTAPRHAIETSIRVASFIDGETETVADTAGLDWVTVAQCHMTLHNFSFIILFLFRTDSEKHEETMGKVMKKFHAGKSSSMIKKKDFVKQMNSGSKYGVSGWFLN